jgi:hypothetical protein
MAQIEMPKAGTPVNKLWTIVADLVKAVNALQNMTVSPPGVGKFVSSDGNVVLQLETTDKCP